MRKIPFLKVFVFILLFSNVPVVVAGSGLVDSLVNRSRKVSLPEAVDLLVRASEIASAERDYEQSMELGRRALFTANKASDPYSLCRSFHRLGNCFFDVGISDSARFYFNLASKTLPDKSDTLLGLIYYHTSMLEFELGDSRKAFPIIDSAIKVLGRSDNLFLYGHAVSVKGVYYHDLGLLDSAEFYYLRSEKIREISGDERGLADCWNNLANVRSDKGDMLDAVRYYQKALVLHERNQYDIGVASIYHNLAMLYQVQGLMSQGEVYLQKALSHWLRSSYPPGEAETYLALGKLYGDQKNFEKSNEYLQYSLDAREKTGDILGMAEVYECYYLNFFANRQLDSARYYIEKSYRIKQEREAIGSFSYTLANLAALEGQSGNHAKGLEYALQALDLARELDFPDQIENASSMLAQFYENSKDYRNAAHYLAIAAEIRESLRNDETEMAVLQQNMQYEFGKKAISDSLRREMELRTQEFRREEELDEQQVYAWTGAGGFGLTCLLSVILFQGYRRQRKFNKLILSQKAVVENEREEAERQKLLAEVKNRELKESIRYAARLQEAVFPDVAAFKKLFPESFLLFKPRDQVSGDFFWFHSFGPDDVLVAVADCTGHGVPGAMVSLVCINALNKAVNEFKKTDPEQILDQVNHLIHEHYATDEIRDGMDIALVRIKRNKEGYTLDFAGANNPVWIIKAKPFGELAEIRGDRKPVGKSVNSEGGFTKKNITLSAGDMIYLFSDGYADQFGGPGGKKMKTGTFRNRLLDISGRFYIQNQQSELENWFNQWQGTHEQVDDVCITGILLS